MEFLIFLGVYIVFILLLLWIAGSSPLTSANDEIEESD